MEKKIVRIINENSDIAYSLKAMIEELRSRYFAEYISSTDCKWYIYPSAWRIITDYASSISPCPIDIYANYTDQYGDKVNYTGKIFGIDFQVCYGNLGSADRIELVYSPRPRTYYNKYSMLNDARMDLKQKYGRDSISKIPGIKDVIFNNPATIVMWRDGTKTVVKCQENDIYDEEKGLAMAIVKKLSGNKGNFNDLFKHWVGVEKND